MHFRLNIRFWCRIRSIFGPYFAHTIQNGRKSSVWSHFSFCYDTFKGRLIFILNKDAAESVSISSWHMSWTWKIVCLLDFYIFMRNCSPRYQLHLLCCQYVTYTSSKMTHFLLHNFLNEAHLVLCNLQFISFYETLYLFRLGKNVCILLLLL